MIKSLKKGEIVVRQGDTKDRNLYIIHRGKFSVQRAVNGNVINCGLLREGDIFGEISMILGSARSSTIISAEDDAEIESLNKASFLALIQKQPEIAWKVLTNLAVKTAKLDELQSQISDAASLRALLTKK